MFEVAVVLGLGLIAFFLAYVAFSLKEDKPYLQVLFFMLALFFLASIPFALMYFSAQPNEPVLAYTDEVSNYWNCTKLANFCVGTPSANSCFAYDAIQCAAIAGCNWTYSQGWYCEGTPTVSCEWLGAYDYTGFKCEETAGCTWMSDTVDATCDRVVVTMSYLNDTNGTGYPANAGQVPWFATMYYVLGALILFMVFYFIIVLFSGAVTELWLQGKGERDGGL